MQKNMSRKSFLAGAGTVAAAAVAGSAAVALADDAKAVAPASEGNIITRETLEQGTWSFMVAPEPVAEDQIAETKTHEIVVVGSGAAGLCCAVSAAEQGADVIVFSAGTKPLSRGGSFQAIGTRGIVFHGTADDWARTLVIKEECAKRKLPLYLTEKANHSMETGNVFRDLEILKEIMEKAEKYIRAL